MQETGQNEPVATRSFVLDALVPVAPETAIDFLAQLDRHRGLHAYLQSAEIVDRGSDASGEWTQWRIVERPRLGPFRYTIRFPARVTRTSPTSLRSSVIAAPGCTLVSTTEADMTDAGGRVSETVTVSAPWMLVAYMHRHALLAHRRTYAALPGVLADRA